MSTKLLIMREKMVLDLVAKVTHLVHDVTYLRNITLNNLDMHRFYLKTINCLKMILFLFLLSENILTPIRMD
jgi:hypothetical protein